MAWRTLRFAITPCLWLVQGNRVRFIGTLLAHVARPNPQWRHFGGRHARAVFQGAHAYVSPSWYGVHPSVPTWNYVAVHAYGVPAVIEDEARVRGLLERLTDTYEAGRPTPWRVEGLPGDYVRPNMRVCLRATICSTTPHSHGIAANPLPNTG